MKKWLWAITILLTALAVFLGIRGAMVREDAPPCFLFHTQDDSCVPVQNSLMMYETLTEKGVRSELHIFPCGDHGVGLGASVPGTCQWPTLAVDFLKRQGFVR